MHVIKVTGVNDAYSQGVPYVLACGDRRPSRAGDVISVPWPVATVYERPAERVLFCPRRDANPFFHLFESLHMLAGRNDAAWLDRFVGDFSARFAEDDGHQHGAYGFRWRRHFDMEGGGHRNLPDQLETLVHLLTVNPRDRRVVLTMWDPVADLGIDRRDVPCNTHAYLRVRTADKWGPGPSVNARSEEVLDLTVCCRSNDAIWGAYGANAVHFSMLQEYLAGRIGVGVGRYTQFSNDLHIYVDVLDKMGEPTPAGEYPGTAPIGQDWSCWDEDLRQFMAWTEADEPDQEPQEYPRNPWFHDTAEPLFVAHTYWKRGERDHALEIINDAAVGPNIAPDWRRAAREWMGRRVKR
jgi:thymidylate synthase